MWLQVAGGSGTEGTHRVNGWKVKVMQGLDVFLREVGTLKRERGIRFAAHEGHRGLCDG